MSTTHSEIPQDAGGDWPQNMRTPQAAAYLTEEHGLPTQPKTMRNWRSTGRGPSYKFYGLTPLERIPVMLQHILRERRSWRRLWRTTVARTVRHGGEVPVQCARHTFAGMP